MESDQTSPVEKKDISIDFSVESSTVDVESLPEVTVKVKW